MWLWAECASGALPVRLPSALLQIWRRPPWGPWGWGVAQGPGRLILGNSASESRQDASSQTRFHPKIWPRTCYFRSVAEEDPRTLIGCLTSYFVVPAMTLKLNICVL